MLFNYQFLCAYGFVGYYSYVVNSTCKIAKIDLFRVIIALHEIGAFKSVDGGELHQKDVIQAFGQMLGEDYSGYTNNVSGGTSTENPEIFDKLKKAFVKYEKKKLKEKEGRG